MDRALQPPGHRRPHRTDGPCAYERFQLVPSDFIDAGAAVLMVAHVDWRGKESGAQGARPIFPAFWLRAAKVFRLETFTERGEALEAVGLSE